MAKVKVLFVCSKCDAQHPKWMGQCPLCQGWNTLSQQESKVTRRASGYAGDNHVALMNLADITLQDQPRTLTGLAELDRVLGGGLVPGSVILIGGDPGIGKSTLLLQTLCYLSGMHKVLYVTGEESPAQVAFRAKRLQAKGECLRVLADTQVEGVLEIACREKPDIIAIDSIQTMYTEEVASAPGGVSQVRESAAKLVGFAKKTGCILFLVGHVTKDGTLAGPRVLEHMVDCVLYFEGQADNRFRVIRAFKNRFGAVNELGVFAMTDKGLREVSNPSAIFLSRTNAQVPGSVVLVTWEGSRPMLVEVQALVDTSHLGNPRRVTVGLEQNRLAMLLAVLHRHAEIPTFDKDVFVNVVGGMRVVETASDLALLFSVVSSLTNQVIPSDLMVFGEIGLSGEIRPVQSGQERLREGMKHGFRRAIVPKANAPKTFSDDFEVIPVTHLSEALAQLKQII
jgi:DNA repair protein RadA/Sms